VALEHLVQHYADNNFCSILSTINSAGRTIQIPNLNNASLIFDKSMAKLRKNDEAFVLIINTRSSKYDDDIFLFAHSLNKFR
jgi:hypothetical protein